MEHVILLKIAVN